MKTPLRTLVVGIGGMGGSHALGYSRLPGYEIAGFVVAGNVERARRLSGELGVKVPIFTDYYAAMPCTVSGFARVIWHMTST